MSENLSMNELIKRVRNSGFNNINEEKINIPLKENLKDIPTKDLIKTTRTKLLIKEAEAPKDSGFGENKITPFDQKEEETKMNNYFNDLNVTIHYKELEVFDNVVIWGGDIDGVIQFIFTVTPFEQSSTYQINYTDEFDPENEDNKKIIDKLKNYYDDFYQYWRDNVISK